MEDIITNVNTKYITKTYKLKDLVSEIVKHSNYKDSEYNWTCVHSCIQFDDFRDNAGNRPKVSDDVIAPISFIRIEFIISKNENLEIYVDKEKIEKFITDITFESIDIPEDYTYSFLYIRESKDITSIQAIASKPVNNTIYDNKLFNF